MFGGSIMPNIDSDELKTQANHIWSMLDDMAANDPAAYRKFIDKQMKEGREAMAPPKPHMCVETSTINPKRPIFINFCGWSRVPEPKSDDDPIPVVGGLLQQFVDEANDNYQVVAVSFNPKVLDDFGLDAKRSDEQDALVNLAIDYLQDQHKLKISRYYKILPRDIPLKGPVENLVQSFKPKFAKEDQKVEKELDELEKTFGPMATGAKDTILNQLHNISLGSTSDMSGNSTINSQPKIVLDPSAHQQPVKMGLIEEIGADVKQEVLCPEFNMKTEKDVLILTISLPGVTSVKDCEVDISEDDVTLFVPGKYKLCQQLPKKISDEDAKAKFNKKLEQLTITMPIR